MQDQTEAFVVKTPGIAPKLELWGLPAPAAGDVLIRVRACGLNFADLLMIDGKYQETPPPPFVPGMEIAGDVVALGPDVTGWAPGDRVMAFVGSGGLARHAVLPANRLRPLPDSMTDVVAAGFQVAYGTSHLVLTRRAGLQSGETLVVLGAAGGVGLTAVEIGKRLGARVVAVARGAEKTAVARAAGADVLIDSADVDLREALRAEGSVDVVYDAVGGDAGNAALRCLAPEGRYLVIGFASGDLPEIKANHLLVKNQTVIGFYWGGYLSFAADALADSLAELVSWHAEGRIHPHVSHVLPLERTEEGLELLRSRKATGKVVITP